MNDGAGAGDLLFVTLHLESREALPFVVDTGAPGTLFDKSLISKLGPRLPLGTWAVRTLDETQQSGIYAAPKLYLGNTRLILGSVVATLDTTTLSSRLGRHVMGILGMDCLRHYCIQLDFEARKVRFLGPDRAASATPGKPFAITFSFPGGQPRIHHVGLTGEKESDLEIDTGFNIDGQVQRGTINGQHSGITNLAACSWDDQTYKDLAVGVTDGASRLGLRFLARHLVTFDFPNRIMHLKLMRTGPLLSDAQQAVGNAAARSAVRFLKSLMQQGRLPGWSANDAVATNDIAFELHSPNAIRCDHLLKRGDSSVYHYELLRASPDTPWTLHKAWRTDPAGRTIEEYPPPAPVSAR